MANKFIRIPEIIAFDKNLRENSKILYGVIYQLATHGKSYDEIDTWADDKWFADKMNLSEDTIKRCIKELEKNGYIKLFIKGKRRIHPLVEIPTKRNIVPTY